jgi:uncharacterized protein YycO
MSFLSKLCSKIHLPYTRKRVTQKKIESALYNLKPGDMILTHVDGELSSLLLSHWSHAGISDIGRVYEATTTGVTCSWLVYFLAHKDDFKILRPTFHYDTKILFDFLKNSVGAKYDFEFESGDNQFYCFELVAAAYMQASQAVISPVKTPAGYQYLAKSFLDKNFIEVPI